MRGFAKNLLVRSGLPEVSRVLNRRRGLILMYHGLTTDPAHPDWTQVTQDAFEEQMAFLERRYRVLPLDDMVQGLANGSLPDRAASITFDDGYRSVFDLALPVLARRRLPATVYLVSRFVGSERHRYLWPDQVSIVLYSCTDREMDLSWAGLGRFSLGSSESIRFARREIIHRLKAMSDSRRQEILDRLQEEHGAGVDHGRFVPYQPMNWEEIKQLEACGLFSIGAHTRTHPILSRVPSASLEAEIQGCRVDIAAHLVQPPRHFAYPNGRTVDFNSEAVEIVRRHFSSATTTVTGLNSVHVDPYRLRRVGIGNSLSLAEFSGLLSGMFFPGS